MPDEIQIQIDGRACRVAPQTSIAAAVLNHGVPIFRRSVTGQPRGPLCGMGTCFECRLTIDGVTHERTCNLLCRPGMDIRTQPPEGVA